MADLKLEIVTGDLSFPEGPVWMADGSVIVVELMAGRLTRIWPDGTKRVVATPGGGPNGAAIGPDGSLYVCNNGMAVRCADGSPLPAGRRSVDLAAGSMTSDVATTVSYEGGRIERIDIATGAVEVLYTHCGNRPLGAPNDIVFDSDGGFWFTDRGQTTATHHGHGGLFYARADGSDIIRAVDRISPNGVGLSPDGQTLYTALTDERLLLAFDIVGTGRVRPVGNFAAGRVIASFPGRQLLDSLAVMADGRIAQAVIWENSGIAVVDPADGSVEHLAFPDHFTTNICFGGSDMRDAWVTLSQAGCLARLRWSGAGLSLAHYA